MKTYILFLLLSISIFGQKKEQYVFTFKYEPKVKLSSKTNSKNLELNRQIENELNKPYEVRVFGNDSFSLVNVIEKVNNSQSIYNMNITPSPYWLLNDFKKNISIEKFSEINNNISIKDSIISIFINPNNINKTILNIEGEEFTASDKDYDYTFLLAKNDSMTISPIRFQFKNYIVLEILQKSKIKNEDDGYREIHYYLDKIEILEEKKYIDFNKLTPKKSISRKEYNKK